MSVTTVSSDSSSGNSCLPEGHLGGPAPPPSRYESQKRRDWNTFGQYLKNHRPPLALSRCSGAHVLEFLRYLDQFGKTKVHTANCPFYGHPHPPAPCPCPLRQAWGSLDALIGRLRAAFEENGGQPEANPFAARAVRLYLREVRDTQAKARGIAYEKKKRRKPQQQRQQAPPPPPPQPQPQQLPSPPRYQLLGPTSQMMVDLNLVNGGYPNPQQLLFHGHVLVPPNDAACQIPLHPSSAPPVTAGGVAAGASRSAAGSLFSPERLLLCEISLSSSSSYPLGDGQNLWSMQD